MRKRKYLQEVSELTSKLSTCMSKKVGVVLVKNNRILAASYNGVVSKQQHCINKYVRGKPFDREEHHKWSLLNELHAEQNLIAFCAKNNILTEGTEIFITMSPCTSCAKLLIASGIKLVHYKEVYDLDDEGLEILKKHEVEVKQW